MTSKIGLIGLGTMGSALAKNIADNGFEIAVYNRTTQVTRDFAAAAGALADKITPTESLEDFVAALARPRAMIVMVPAGAAVDAVIAALTPLLDNGDLIIDAGNANFRDTRRRSEELASAGLLFMGMGVSGGEEGARFGPSIMGGGPKQAWERVRDVMEAIAAEFEGTPCATWMGPDGAGHFVKTVHNGIEYADMQMIAEVYGIMRDGMGLPAAEIGAVFDRWNAGPLKSYLIEISGKVLNAIDPETGLPVLDIILDRAGQKGTGRWTLIEAQHLAAPVTAIEAAVAARNFSSRLEERLSGQAIFGAAPQPVAKDDGLIDKLEQALLAGKIACYAQGFGLLAAASREFGWNLPMPAIAEVWREGCIIRSAMLNDMAQALRADADTNLMFAPKFAAHLSANHGGLREVVSLAALSGTPAPALSAALSYFDMMRTGRSTANMLQAQRDYFGRHTFQRVDREGAFNGPWAEG